VSNFQFGQSSCSGHCMSHAWPLTLRMPLHAWCLPYPRKGGGSHWHVYLVIPRLVHLLNPLVHVVPWSECVGRPLISF
jgi:hypothetical protein